ncbi:hypothetical protein A6X21_08495 [Planctopirus hydrillae]|uniref:Uncharacterized protein n=1 Tax=Planctopirus hydrillae TaxID=1841610 RepID=A0A1C3E8B5_9PLAN|nr:hypothetical protein A6X21_08495 [Planctopirus hydrillae]
MTTRIVETPNPATTSASFPLVPLLKPASGNLTLTANVNRDPGDDSPVTAQLLNGATVLGSTNLTTPAGPGSVSFPTKIPGRMDIRSCR